MNIQTLQKREEAQIFPQMLLPVKKIDLSKPSEFKKNLNTIAVLYGLAEEALVKLKNGHLTALDALATDCSCHLRALYLTMLARELLNPSSELMARLDLAREALKSKQEALCSLNKALVIWCQKGRKMPEEDQVQNEDIHLKGIKVLQKQQGSLSFVFDLDKVMTAFDLAVQLPPSLAYGVHAFLLTLVKDYRLVGQSDKMSCADCQQYLGRVLILF